MLMHGAFELFISPRRQFWALALLLAMAFVSTNAGAQTRAQTDPVSKNWVQREQERFGSVLAARPMHVLIPPFQVLDYALDPAERLLLAARLADHVATTTTLTVADPLLVGRALGEGWRNYREADILALADRIQARKIVLGFAGHDGGRKLRMQVRILQKVESAWQVSAQQTWDDLSLSDAQPPYQVAAGKFAEVTAKLKAVARQAPSYSISVAAPRQLPALPQVVRGAGALANNIHVAQLLAGCYPRYPEGGHERAWIRTLLAAHRASDNDTRLPRARALLHLHRRPAALAALGEPKSAAEQALREILNGNLPEAKAATAKISDPVLRLLAQIEIRDLRMTYAAANTSVEVRELGSLLPRQSEWYPFLEARVAGEGSVWGVEPIEAVIARFEGVIGNEPTGKLFEDVEASDDAVVRQVSLGAAALKSYDTLVERAATASDAHNLPRDLLLDLYQAQIATVLMGEVYLTLDTRRQIDLGRRLLDRLQPLLAGHPDFRIANARHAWYEYARRRGPQRASWQQVAVTNTQEAYRFAGKLTRAIEFTEREAPRAREIDTVLDPLRARYSWDWPIDVRWIPAAVREDSRAMERYAEGLIQYAVAEFGTLSWLADKKVVANRRVALLAASANRFNGNPDLAEYRADSLLSQFDVKGADGVFRQYVAGRPMAVGPFMQYAYFLIAQGRHAEAAAMFARYPGFEPDSGESKVALSNHAAYVAQAFWDAGQFEHGRSLFLRSADYNTGSGPSLYSAALLALDEGEPARAAKIHMQTARRYSDIGALQKYFSLIFPLGRASEAWRVYDEVYRDGNGGRVLSAIANGTRVLKWSDKQVLEWLANPKNAKLADGTFFYAPRVALAAAIVDRALPPDLASLVSSTPTPYRLDSVGGKILPRVESTATARTREPCGPSSYGVLPGFASMTQVDSHLIYFARGYQALDRGEAAAAFKTFDTAVRLFESYTNDCERTAYLLPYLALAAIKVKDTEALEKYLSKFAYKNRSVYFNLAQAILAAGDARHPEAMGFLDAARNRWSDVSLDPLPKRYIYADVLERLYRETQVNVYRERLIRWSKDCQRVSPADAWPYAKEYAYSTSVADRARALRMALFLDPQSFTLRNVSASERSAALAGLAAKDPFASELKKRRAMAKSSAAQ